MLAHRGALRPTNYITGRPRHQVFQLGARRVRRCTDTAVPGTCAVAGGGAETKAGGGDRSNTAAGVEQTEGGVRKRVV